MKNYKKNISNNNYIININQQVNSKSHTLIYFEIDNVNLNYIEHYRLLNTVEKSRIISTRFGFTLLKTI